MRSAGCPGIGSRAREACSCAVTRRDVAARLASRERDRSLVELGCGNGEKLELLIDALPRESGTDVHLIDISVDGAEGDDGARVALRPDQCLGPSRAPTNRGWRRCGRSSSTIRARSSSSSARTSAISIRRRPTRCSARSASRWRRGALLLLGADLVKPEQDLLLAYDDPLGVTAAFNRNLLVRINRELDADFDVAAFAHRAIWNAREQRVEMHLVSRATQQVYLAAADVRVAVRRRRIDLDRELLQIHARVAAPI